MSFCIGVAMASHESIRLCAGNEENSNLKQIDINSLKNLPEGRILYCFGLDIKI